MRIHPLLNEHIRFEKAFEGTTGDNINSKKYLYEIYQMHDGDVSCKVTVPVLWDKKLNKIVNNESADIIRILNSSLNEFAQNDIDLYPKKLQDEIDSINESVYKHVNNGVYKTGFAQNQSAYEKNFKNLFNTLDELDKRLADQKFLIADQLTEADIRLVTTLLRFDIVYYSHFKCNKKQIRDYPHLFRYLKGLYELPAVSETTNFSHIKRHYYYSHEFLNPHRIVPLGPELNL